MPTPLTPWLTLRQARESLRAGQLDSARQQLAPLVADRYRHALRLSRRLLIAYLTRAERHLRADQPEAAWRDLQAAEAIDAGEPSVVRLRAALVRLGLAEMRAALEAGNPTGAVRAAALLRSHGAEGAEFERLDDLAQEWLLAVEQADRGDFLLARDTAARMRRGLEPALAEALGRFGDELAERYERFQTAFGLLREAAEARDWSRAVRRADEAVALAPRHREARNLRLRAWELLPLHLAGDDSDIADCGVRSAESTAPYRPADSSGSQSATREVGPSRRFLLWIDGVGGYLVCLAPRVSLGQATGGAPVDVPLFADVSSLHAELLRDGEGYVVESGRDVQVNGRAVKREALSCGDRLTLGATCQFVFRRPVPISPTARLELVSGHRMPMAVDGVLLMAESLILGDGGRSHVALPGAGPSGVVLYRSREGLGVRCGAKFAVDGRPAEGRSPLALPAVVTGEAFCFALEPVGSRL